MRWMGGARREPQTAPQCRQKVRLLAADKDLQVEHSGEAVTVVVPSVLDHEVVAIDL
jgi:hypothetical protein